MSACQAIVAKPIAVLAAVMLALLSSKAGTAQTWRGASPTVHVRATLDSLVGDEDTDGDTKITIDDPHIAGTTRGDRKFWFRSVDGRIYEVAGTYYLSNLLAALKRAEDEGRDTAAMRAEDIFGSPVVQIARSIREQYWKGLTRRIDEDGIAQIFRDEKTRTVDGSNCVYVPRGDSLALDYFTGIARFRTDLKMVVVRLPEVISPQYAKSLDGRHGILSLRLSRDGSGKIEGTPFVVPGGRFNEMYGWDSFFITLGLLNDGYTDLAKSMVDNFTYEIDHYGRILNANRTYYLTRSQPPFFTSMASAVFDKLPQDSTSRAWLAGVLDAAIREYRNVWMGKDHLTTTGLSRYFDGGIGPPPEVELGRFDRVFAHYAKIAGVDPARFQREYTAGARKVPELDKFFRDDRSMRESGHDASYRLQYDCAELVTVDLNALLYKTESDIAGMLSRVFGGKIRLRDGSVEKSDDWSRAAVKRKALMNEYLWDENEGMYFDFNFKKHIRTTFVSATTFYPLWANVASKEQAEKLIQHALPLLRMPGGLAGSTEQSRGAVTTDHPQTQWDYPFGWAPHQILLWRGLKNYGYDQEAREMAYRWLYTITLNAANYNGTITEKYDVVGRSSQVFAEYGNVGTKFSYVTREGFGWTDASYTIGLTYLSQKEIDDLSRLIPPEWE